MNSKKAYQKLLAELTPANLFSKKMQWLMRHLPLEDREELASQTHTMVVYYDQEVTDVRIAEENAAMRAAPQGYDLNDLNGVNVGCGDRIIHESLIGCDAHKGKWSIEGAQNQVYESKSKILSWSHDLPFKKESMDFIVALHILEHVADPVEIVLEWLDIIKPGGGLGIIVPDWRYTWDARNDHNIWSHRWNPTPKLVKKLYDEHWGHAAVLEHFCTYRWKLSFDFVLRKHGEFMAFDLKDAAKIPTGNQLFENGKFYHLDD